MRDRQAWPVDDGVAVEQDVDVDLARAPALTLLATELALDLLYGKQESDWRQRGDDLDDRVVEGWLIDHADGRRLEESGAPHDMDIRASIKLTDRIEDRVSCVADVRAQAEVYPGQGRYGVAGRVVPAAHNGIRHPGDPDTRADIMDPHDLSAA